MVCLLLEVIKLHDHCSDVAPGSAGIYYLILQKSQFSVYACYL